MLQLVPLLARIAAEAGEMRVGAGILLLTLLNPVEVAENAATLDAITDGRFVLGLGLGYRQEENDAFGLPEKRLAVFEQKLDVVRRLLEGEAVTAEGHGFRLRDQQLALRPTQTPRPPIWLAANNDNAVLRAARLADAWLLNPHTKLDELERQLVLYHAERERCGLPRAGEIPIIKELHVGSDDESAMRAVRPFLEDKYKAYVQWGQSEVLPEGDTLRQAFDQLAQGGRFIVGGPESCARQVREHVDRLGATTFLFRFQWPGMPHELVLSSLRRAAEEVFPLLRA
jgi:alkanesulfonate monooxygenase SsuD/methylene tetrahydromethanopterin reductase-like flavin-dependent oxidoreductase (luciferase family)